MITPPRQVLVVDFDGLVRAAALARGEVDRLVGEPFPRTLSGFLDISARWRHSASAWAALCYAAEDTHDVRWLLWSREYHRAISEALRVEQLLLQVLGTPGRRRSTR